MNHLAHLFLSQSDIHLMVGNYIADHVKGKQLLNYSKNVQIGIEMHRAIDQFTDEHRIVKESKKRLYPKYAKYAPVLVDMFYDHILAKKWENYSPIPLQTFTQNVYLALKSQYAIFPKSAQLMYDHMSAHDWLSNYANLEGMQKALNGLSRRAKFDSKMNKALVDLEHDFDLYAKEFELFFPELIIFTNQWTKAYE